MAIKIACCGGMDNIKGIHDAGMRYIELALNSITEMSESDFQQLVAQLEHYGLKCLTVNGFFPWEMKLVGPERDMGEIEAYLEKAMDRLRIVGAKTAVLGCGGGRKITEGVERAQVEKEFGEIILLASRYTANVGACVAVESLNTRETNFLTTVTETTDYVNALKNNRVFGVDLGVATLENVGVLADFYHMRMDDENIDNVIYAGELLFHTHIARNIDRAFPMDVAEDKYTEFVHALEKIHYDGVISIEGRTENYDKDAKTAFAVMNSICGG